MTHEADCHYGDHDWLGNGRCRWCWAFNPGILLIAKMEKRKAARR